MKRTVIVLMLLVIAAPSAGCRQMLGIDKALMLADTHTREKSGFTTQSPQYAWAGEPVNFYFAPDPNLTEYAVYLWPGLEEEFVPHARTEKTFYPATHSFQAAPGESRSYVVHATGYAVRGQRDWFYDQQAGEWEYLRPQTDEPDFRSGDARIEIICYQREIDVTVGSRERKPERVVLQMLPDGERSDPHTVPAEGDDPIRLIGPDAEGRYRLLYIPRWDEVNRVGTTPYELVVTYADGEQQVMRGTLETP